MLANRGGLTRPMVRGFAAIVAAMTLISSAQASECALSSEAAALRARVVQSQALVAALSCGEQARYNSFVAKYQRELVASGRALHQFFQRAYGQSGAAKLNRFVTEMANRESSRSMVDRAAYCSDAAALFDELAAARPDSLIEVVASQPNANDNGFPVCIQRASTGVAAADPAR